MKNSVLRSALTQFGKISAQAFLLYAAIGIVIVLLVTVLKKKKPLLRDVLTGIVLSGYGSIMIQLTLICRESGSRIGIDLSAFRGLFGQGTWFRLLMWTYVILNGLLFVPYGFTLSLFSAINDRKPSIQLLSITLLSFMTSMMIECTQLLTGRGYFEVQDLVVNTIGGMGGWCLLRMVFVVGDFVVGKHSKEK